MSEPDRKHEENLQNFQDLKDIFSDHDGRDEEFKILVLKQFERMEPMVKTFENKKIVRSFIDEETNTWYIYTRKFLTLSTLVISLWALGVWIMNHFK